MSKLCKIGFHKWRYLEVHRHGYREEGDTRVCCKEGCKKKERYCTVELGGVGGGWWVDAKKYTGIIGDLTEVMMKQK